MMVFYKLQVATLATVLFVLIIDSTSANKRHCENGSKVSSGGLSCQTCKHGCYGSRCSQRCRHCDSAGCDRVTGRCHRCRPGRYGVTCHQRCARCDVGAHCDRQDGTCIKTCPSGVFGVLCNQRCPRKCKTSVCRKKNGHCHLGCKRGWKGIFCNDTCSSNCLINVCHDNGVCKHGCTSGFYGQLCDRKCSAGVPTECDRLTGCSSTCRQGLCYPNNGSCARGCTQGWRGPRCNERFPDQNRSSSSNQMRPDRSNSSNEMHPDRSNSSNETRPDECQPGLGGHCDDGATGGGYSPVSRILLIFGAGLVITTVLGSIAACCNEEYRERIFRQIRTKKKNAAYMKLVSPVYLGTVSKEVKLKQGSHV